MSLLELEKEENQKSLEFKRKLIMLVKQHPCIWSNCYMHQRKDAWITIEKEMGFPNTKAKLQSLWGALRSRYFKKIFIRTIERNFEAPKWKFFHDMSFIYEFVKENIQKKLGGISPPLFKARPNPKGSPSYRCPCCVYNEVDINLEPHTSSVEVTQNNEIGSIATAESNTSFENCQKTIENSTGSVDSETAPSTYSQDVEDNVNQSSFVKNSPELQIDDTNISLVQSTSSEITNDKTIDLIDDTETRLSAKSKSSDDTTAEMSAVCRRAIERPKIIKAVKANPGTYLFDSQLITKDGYNLAWQQVLKEVGTLSLNTIKNRWRLIKMRYLNELVHERYATGMYISAWEHFNEMEFLRPHMQKDLNVIHLTRIQVQDSIKKRTEESIHRVQTTPECNKPLIDDKTKELLSSINYTPEMQFNNSDKRLIAYVNANQNFQIARVETLQTTKTYCRKPQQIEQPDVLHDNTLPILRPIKITAPQVLSSLDLTNEDETDCITEAQPAANKIQTSRGFEKNETTAHAAETHQRLPSPPAFEFTNENDTEISSDNAETPPPAKKLRKSTETRKIEINLVANEIPKRLLLPPASCLTLDLTADEATIQPAATVKSQQLQLPKTQKVFPPLESTESRKIVKKTVATEVPKRLLLPPASCFTLDLTADEATIQPAATVQRQQLHLPKTQKVFPPLDLTLDDEPPVAVPEPAFNNISTSIYQQGVVDELVNTSKLFPTFDLTTEEDKDQNKNASNDNDIVSISKDGDAKNDENVICLDDDDSVSSYEEVLVYFSQEEDKN